MDPALVSVLGCLAGRGAQVDPAYMTATFRGTCRTRPVPVILVSRPRLVSSSRLPLLLVQGFFPARPGMPPSILKKPAS
eukprot:10598225-Alexandrium_andersonii.AAC.1